MYESPNQTVLENRCGILDDTDCTVDNKRYCLGIGDWDGRPMINSRNRVCDWYMIDRPTSLRIQTKSIAQVYTMACLRETDVDYFDVHEDDNPFLDPSTLDHLDSDQKNDVDWEMNKIMEEAF